MSLIKSNFNDWPNLSSFFDNDWLKSYFPVSAHLPAINVVSNNGNFELEVAAPGFEKDQINASIENGVLTIKGETKREKEEQDKNYTRKEFSSSSFSRSLNLPDNIDENSINAKFDNGILKITLAKTEKETNDKKNIEIL